MAWYGPWGNPHPQPCAARPTPACALCYHVVVLLLAAVVVVVVVVVVAGTSQGLE